MVKLDKTSKVTLERDKDDDENCVISWWKQRIQKQSIKGTVNHWKNVDIACAGLYTKMVYAPTQA